MQVNKLLPEVYYKESRDFAYIGRLLEVIFNYMKTAADCIDVDNSEYLDANIVELLINNLGFESKHKYQTKDLIFVASGFSSMLKQKGTGVAIELAIKLLLNSQQIEVSSDFKFYDLVEETKELCINIPYQLTDTILLEDIFDYILPAGITYHFARISNFDNTALNTFVATASVDVKKRIEGESKYGAWDNQLGIVRSELPEELNSNIASADIDKHYIENPGMFTSGVVVSAIDESAIPEIADDSNNQDSTESDQTE